MVIGLLKSIGGTFVAMLAVSLALGPAATTAWGSTVGNPGWRACEEGKGSGTKFADAECSEAFSEGRFEELPFTTSAESRKLFIESNGEEKLDFDGAEVSCKDLGAGESSKVFGGDPGTAELTLEYGGCEVRSHPKCTIDGHEGGSADITTDPLEAELAYLSKEAAEKGDAEETATVFEPAEGEVFAKVDLEGECGAAAGEHTIVGGFAAENVEGAKKKKDRLVRAEKPIDTYWTNGAEGPVERHTELWSGGVEGIIIFHGGLLIIEDGFAREHLWGWIIIFTSTL